jgi:hypothetical protein
MLHYGFTDTTIYPKNEVEKKKQEEVNTQQTKPTEKPKHPPKTKATDLRIVTPYSTNDKSSYKVLYNYKDFMFRMKFAKETQHPPSLYVDFLCLHKVNFRTAFKLNSDCCICRSRYKLQNHHIKPLKNGPNRYPTYNGFDKIVAALGRKQITVCGFCHEKIHKGLYDGLSLNQIYDARLCPSEGYLKLKLEGPPTEKKKKILKEKVGSEYQIDWENRTIYHPFIQNSKKHT